VPSLPAARQATSTIADMTWAISRLRIRPGRGGSALVLASVLALAVTSCSSGSSGGDDPVTRGTSGCTVNAKAVPSCGVLWGIATQPPTISRLQQVEKTLGRSFDFVYRYHDINDQVPDAEERQVVRQGRLLHIAIAARDFRTGNRSGVTWADLAAGKYDDTLSAQARGVASLKKPVFVTFDQEANQHAKLGVSGNAAQFKAAWRHLHDLYQAAGATNAVWTWVMTGNARNLNRAASLWPGNDVVDWISWNVYNQSGCLHGQVEQTKYRSFADELKPFYEFVKKRGPSVGMDTSKPMMISETGSVRYTASPDLAANWYAAIPATLRRYPQIKAVGLWDSVSGSCDYDFEAQQQVADGVRKAGLDPHVDTGRKLSPSS
jgi:hypothetical protein